MKIGPREEWFAFALGLVIAAMVWFRIHPDVGKALANAVVRPADAEVTVNESQSRETGAENENDDGLIQPGDGTQNLHENSHRGAGGGEPNDRKRNASAERDSERAADAANGDPGQRQSANSANRDSGQRPSAHGATRDSAEDTAPQPIVHVYLTDEQRIERVPLETYVRGVVAAEMPAGFEPAALEAQALAARTYIVRRLLRGDTSGVPVPGADVTDTESHQAYRSLAEMNRLRSDNENAWHKANDAANRTKGKIIAYDGEPIQALYFSTSNGYTENSEEVFPHRIPYLRSVASPWDREGAPRSQETVRMPLKQFYAKLGIRTLPTLSRLTGSPKIKITEWTEGKRVKKATVGGKSFTGLEIRELLGLRSAAFTWTAKDGEIVITTYGSGHGVGMSQWGANGMAEAGYDAEQIIRHYYPGTELMEVSNLADKL